MSSAFPESEQLEGPNYSGDFQPVPVDSSGFYDEAVAMEELCYCVGVASIHEDGIYAAHVSPGEIGSSPEEIMSEFEEGEETYVVAGVKSLEYDPETFEEVSSALDGDFQVFSAEKFALNEEGEIFEEFEEKSRGSPLTSSVR